MPVDTRNGLVTARRNVGVEYLEDCMPENREKLTPESLQRLVDRIKKDAQLRTEMIDKVKRNGVTAVVNEFFVLQGKQSDNLKDVEKILSSAVPDALQSGGNIRLRLTQPDTTLIQPRTAVHVGVGLPGGPSIDVDVECLQ